MTVFLDDGDVAYFDDLFARRSEAVAPERRRVVFRTGAEPQMMRVTPMLCSGLPKRPTSHPSWAG